MIQDIENKNLDNQYRTTSPEDNDRVLCFSGKDILLDRNEKDELFMPLYSEVKEVCASWEPWIENPFRFTFEMEGANYYIYLGKAELFGRYGFEPAPTLRQLVSKEFGSTCFRSFLTISAPFRSETHPFRHSYLHCFHVLRSCLWDKLWSKRYSLNTVSAVLREFFVACMVTLTVAKVKAFRETNFAP